MEDDKKKKRNKKKKNKQSTTVEGRVDGSGEAVSGDQNLVNHGKNENSKFLETADVDTNRHRPNGKECANPEEIIPKSRDENDIHIRNEAISQETIKKLKEEIDKHIQKEAFSEETIRKLKEQKDIHIQKEAFSEEAVRKLKEQHDIHIQDEVRLEETINKLRAENETQMQKQAGLEMQIAQLQCEKRSLIHKEVSLEETINKLRAENEFQMQKQPGLELQIAQLQGEKESLIHKELLNEKSGLRLKEESLEKKIKVLETDLSSSIEKQNSSKETILKLNGDVNRLQSQVAELQQSRDSLLLENQHLIGNVSSLQSTIQNLKKSSSASLPLDASAKDNASEHEDMKAQIEAAHTLVDKLVEENAGVVEKVNELHVELVRQSPVAGLSEATYPTDRADEVTKFAKPAGVAIPMTESLEITPVSSQELEVALIKDSSDTPDAEHAAGVVPNASIVSDDSGEIVQIPLDDNDVRDPEFQPAKNVELDTVPLTDAPLIGAPFRLISFVAKYVSGADLVNNSSSNTSH